MDCIENDPKVLFFGIWIAFFLLKSRRIHKGIELLKECLFTLNNLQKALAKRSELKMVLKFSVYRGMLYGYELLRDHTGAIECGKKVMIFARKLGMRFEEGRATFKLAHFYHKQHKYEEAKQFFTIALPITLETYDKKTEGACYGNLGSIFYSLNELKKAQEYFQKALKIQLESGDKCGEATTYSNLGVVFQSFGEYEKAEEYHQKALEIQIEIGATNGEAPTYTNLGVVFQSLAEYEKAKEYHQKALKIHIESGNRNGEATAYGNLGAVFQSLGEYEKAKEYLQKALEILIEIGNRNGEATTYGNLGAVFQSLGEYGKAEEYLQKALKIKTEIGDRCGEAKTYGNLGAVFQSLGEYEKAKEYLQKALEILIETGDKNGEATTYGNLGVVFQSLGEYEKAEEYHQKALEILIEIGDKRGEATTYGNLGEVFQSLGKYEKAKEYHQKALKIQIQIGNRKGEATTYGNLGVVFQSLGEYGKAEEYHKKALKIHIEIGDKCGAAKTYGNLGGVFQSHSEYGKAEEYHQKALKIQIEIGDKNGEATTYRNLGVVFQSLSEYEKAEEYHQKALEIQIEIGDKNGEATTYGNLGVVFQYLGKYEKAEECLHEALEILIEIGDKNREAATYTDLGAVFQSLGEYEKAEEYHQKALEILIEIGDKRGEATTYGNLGVVFQSLGEYEKAKEYHHKALKIIIEIGNRKGEAATYGNLGAVFQSLGEYGKAEEYHEKALKIHIEIGNKRGEAATYKNLGRVFIHLSEYSRAKEYAEKALSLAYNIGDIELQCTLHCDRAFLTLKLTGNIDEAVSCLRKSIAKSEEMRHFLKHNDHFKICSLDVHISPYKFLSGLFSKIGKFNEALHVTELARARALADMMSARYSVEHEISVNPQSWVGIERIMTKEVDSVCLYCSYHDTYLSLWLIKGNKPVVFRQKDVNDCLSGNGAPRTVEEVFSAKSFRNVFLLLTQDHCEDRSFVPSNAGCLAPSRPFEEDEDDDQYPEPASFTQCYKMIIDPVAHLLSEPEIIIVPEGSLYNLPFAALNDENGKYLSESFRIRLIPSLTTLKLLHDSPADYHSQTGALIVGEPDVSHVHYKGGTMELCPLPCAREEAEMIGRLLGVKPLLGEHATKQAVLEGIQSVSLIHVAAHGNAERGEIALAPARPYNGIPQEEDYLLTMAEIAHIRLKAKLVVLSCCHSAKGQIRSEGVVGIARAFLGSGARSVLVSLWALEDKATKQFMSRFYEHLVGGESASESLHQAMKWMRSNGFSEVEYWAPFELIGDNVTFDF